MTDNVATYKEAIDYLNNSFEELSSKNENGLDLTDYDRFAIRERSGSFTDFVGGFVKSTRDRDIQQRLFRNVFFWSVMVLFVGITISCIMILMVNAFRETVYWPNVASIATAFGTLLSAMIILPKIIANHLFPASEQDRSIDLFSKVLEEDRETRKSYQRKVS